MSGEANKALIRQSTADFNARRWDSFYARIAPDYLVHGLPPGTPTSREVVRQFQQALLMAFPDLQFTHHDVLADGDTVAIRETASGTHRGEYMGTPATGKRVAWSRIGIDRIADGKFVEGWGESDALSLLQQIGAVPGPVPRTPQDEQRMMPRLMAAAPGSLKANKAIVRRWLEESWREGTRGNLDIFDELATDDFAGHFLPLGLPRGPAGPKQSMQAALKAGAMAAAVCTVEDQVAEGDRVASRFTFSFTHKGPLMGIPATGKRVTMSGINLDRIAGGKVAESWTVEDLLGMLRQLGGLPALG